MRKVDYLQLLEVAIEAAVEAAKEILQVYDSDFAVEHKDDKSPLTLADRKAHEKIEEYLLKTGLPILSEEGKDIPYEERKDWKYFWMVDPLDGTKEFIKRNGEFTVNIALIHQERPVMGVIYVPVTGILYFGMNEIGSFKNSKLQTPNSELVNFKLILETSDKLPLETNLSAYTVVASRSHLSTETEAFIEELKEEHKQVELAAMGSSLKICLVAEGKADIYPRFAPTMEWDTAAGQAIAEAAGKKVIDHQSGERMRYNKKNLLNNWFVVK